MPDENHLSLRHARTFLPEAQFRGGSLIRTALNYSDVPAHMPLFAARKGRRSLMAHVISPITLFQGAKAGGLGDAKLAHRPRCGGVK
ncbi:hypothetical protein JTE90_014150 [Oedothorax gibbosus]|uniref:Uncharacterized protein n=1 Tax=Oedothorax gibbosus TaxID=931172 RepID=A0AAV6VIN7_9ARAC|nr:hypothetical protein JTE90_014150 [Oedothorax gibbosus]